MSTLTGVPFTLGAAIVYRGAAGDAPRPYATGFKTITDLAFGPDGSLYVLQFASGPLFFAGPGSLVRVAPGGARTTVADGLPSATAVAIAGDGTIYVAINGDHPGIGQVLRLAP